MGPTPGAGASRHSKRLKLPFVWIDLEMTGLDPDKDVILEIACVVTDCMLETVERGPDLTIHHPDAILCAMNDWSQEQHAASGLTEQCRASQTSVMEAEDRVLAFVKSFNPRPGAMKLAGNSVHVDREFLRVHMPRLHAHLSHRIIDVSTVASLASYWRPKKFNEKPQKVGWGRWGVGTWGEVRVGRDIWGATYGGGTGAGEHGVYPRRV